jgi:hypothetical protein
MEDAVIDIIETIDRLETLAAWHRLNADHAGSPWIWEARLLTAEDLERRVAQLREREAHDAMRRAVRPAAPRRAMRYSSTVRKPIISTITPPDGTPIYHANRDARHAGGIQP